MRSIRLVEALTILTVTLASTGTARAQSAVRGAEAAVACRAYPPTTQSLKRKLWDGYEISLRPVRDTEASEDVCTAAIYNREGRVVYRTSGSNVTFDQEFTSQDFDGDGKPEVVFQTDMGGGMGCCWECNVTSLYPKPHKLFDVYGARLEKDVQGKMLVWVPTTGPMGFTSMAQAPYAERMYRVQEGKLVEVTQDFCGRIFSTQNRDFLEWTSYLTAEDIQEIGAPTQTTDQKAKQMEIVSSLLSRALQHVYCRRYDDALVDLNLWPADTRAKNESRVRRQDQIRFSRLCCPTHTIK